MEKNNKEFETIFNCSNDGIAILDLNLNFLNFNKAYLEMTGYSEEELYKKTCLELTSVEDRERSEAIFEQVLRTEAVKNFEKTCIVNNEKRIRTNVSISLFPDKAQFLLMVKDVSSLKEIEEHARIVSLSELLCNIAHQWRQPLSMISTVASGMKVSQEHGILKEKDIVKNMDKIVEQTEYLSRTIEKFSRLVRVDTELEKINLSMLLNETISLIRASLDNSAINLEINCINDAIVECHRTEVIQALINIINNAIDAIDKNVSSKENKYLLITIQKIANNKIKLEILDNGGGIKEDIKHRIFEPYFTTKHRSLGIGIGLSTTYEILHEKHYYKIEVYNKEFFHNEKKFKGACFSIIFNTY